MKRRNCFKKASRLPLVKRALSIPTLSQRSNTASSCLLGGRPPPPPPLQLMLLSVICSGSSLIEIRTQISSPTRCRRLICSMIQFSFNLSLPEQRSILLHATERLLDTGFIDSLPDHMQWPDVIPGFLHFEGLGIPPFHRGCTCLIEAAIPGSRDHQGPAHELKRYERQAKQTRVKIRVQRQ
jgi:hypothetical protein